MTDASSVPKANAHFDQSASDYWVRYHRYRPVYPPELFETIFSFHASTPSAEYSSAWDFGCGPGSTFPALLGNFHHVTGGDTNVHQAEVIRRLMGDKWPEARLTVLAGKAEELAEQAEQSSVDLVITAEALHWFDVSRWFEAVGRMLKPEGTVAVVQYCYEELGDHEANHLWQSYLHRTMNRIPRQTPIPTTPGASNGGGMAVMNSLLSSVAVPSDIFHQETRHAFLTPFLTPTSHLCDPWEPKESSDCVRVDGGMLLKSTRTVEDMRESLKTLGRLVEMEQKFDGGKDMEQTLAGLREIYGDKEFEIRWPLMILMAKKRS